MPNMEILAPAGSVPALEAAVYNGADAVYLGLSEFNARMGAENFTEENIADSIAFCHERGVRVHAVLNTLVSDREMPLALKTAKTLASAGVDAFIVQDLGMVSLCRQLAPDVPIHASTQMSIHSLEGVLEAAALGCSRVVLARELPAEEIAHICKKSPVEIEVFVHGALCMCYSGQCYLSSLIGGRSGNRGLCAQPCRMKYGWGSRADEYPLSLKDMSLASHLGELEQMGVACLKIEGRMKRPEYVAIVTGVYARALREKREPTAEEMAQLEAAFSRQGFTQGYFLDRKGPEMFGTRQDEVEPRELFTQARATYESGENRKEPVKIYAMIQAGQPARIAVEDKEGHITPKIKISENAAKITTPHFKKVYRFYGRDTGKAIADLITLHDEQVDDTQDLEIFDPMATWKKKTVYNFTARELLVPVFLKGKRVYDSPTLPEIQAYCRQQVDTLWDEVKRFDNPHKYVVDLSRKLWDIQQELLRSSQR